MFKLEEGWLTVALLAAMIVVAAGGVGAAQWTDGLHTAWIAGLTGVLVGLALAKSSFSGSTAFAMSIIYGGAAVGFFTALGLDGNWHARSVELVTRLNLFLYKFAHGGTSRDALPFPVAISLLFFFVGVLNSWSVFRRGAVWPALIPAGVGLLVNAYYYLGPARLDLYLAVYVLLGLMFVARMNLLVREREWQSARVVYSPDLRIDFLRAGLAAALVGVMVAWAAPSLAASPEAATTWRRMTTSLSFVRESWMRMFASVRGYGQAYTDFYGDSLTLGGPSNLSPEPIMDITVKSAQSAVEEPGVDPAAAALPTIPRYYWRSISYAVYDEGRWRTGEVDYKEFQPGRSRLEVLPYQQRRVVNVAVTMHVPASSKLYTAAQVHWLDRASVLEFNFDPAGLYDIASVRAQDVVRRGETYQMLASVSVADAESLRQAGTRYPEWVRASFLQLPDEITPRTRELAQEIVSEAGAITPYDRVEAVTRFLRTHIEYAQDIDAPPEGVEAVDWVLFEDPRGYCTYYASAEVVLLRSLGIPARLVVGMAQGEQDPRTGVYHVLEADAHAWPEAYFPGFGWVEFEPTASESPLVRPAAVERPDVLAGVDDLPPEDEESKQDLLGEGQNPDEGMEDLNAAGTTPVRRTWVDRVPWAAVGGVAGGSALALLAVGLVSFRLGIVGWEHLGRVGGWVLKRRGRGLPSAIGALYLQLERVAHWLGLGAAQSVTPYERATALGQRLPEVGAGVDTITREYVTEQYSPRPADVGTARSAWKGIRLKVWHDAVRALLLDVLEEEPPAPKGWKRQ